MLDAHPQGSIASLLEADTPPSDTAVASAVMADIRRLAERFAPSPDDAWPGSYERGAEERLIRSVGVELVAAHLKTHDQNVGPAADALIRGAMKAVEEVSRPYRDRDDIYDAVDKAEIAFFDLRTAAEDVADSMADAYEDTV